MAREINVKILGDSRDVEKAYARSSKAAQNFYNDVNRGSIRAEIGFGNMRRQAVGFAGGFLAVDAAARALGEGLQVSVDAASNLNEQLSKSQIVFGASAGEIEDWSKTTARSFGIAQDEALAAAGTFGNLFTTVGIGRRTNAQMSRSLVELAADLAAFNNTNPTEALDALRSGLIGEAEPLRRYGVLLSETRVQQEAMRESGKRNARALTDQEKALARYRIILEDTKTAQGNFAATSDDFAQQTKKLKAQMRDLSAAIGTVLIPWLTELVTTMNEGVEAAGQLATKIKQVKDAIPVPDAVSKGWKEIVLRLNPATAAYKNLKLAIDLVNKALGNTASAAEQGLRAMDKIEAHRLERAPTDTDAPVTRTAAPLTAEQRREFFDARIARRVDRVQDIASIRGQIAELRQIAVLIEQRIKATKDITRRLRLEDDVLDIQRMIRSRQTELRENAAAAARERAAMAEEARQQRLETQTGWLEFAVERAEATEGIRDDTRAWRAIEKFLMERIRREGRKLELARDLWRAQQKLRDLAKTQPDSDPLAGLMQASTKQLLGILSAGTGLRGVGRRTLAGNIAGLQLPPIYLTMDSQVVGKAVTKDQTRTGRRTSQQTSGRRG